ncbi:MAG TPA: dienelactone hydrolase family protein [Alphaproteobacteria bacterium]|jgi:carboxymethylenebutenolidase
MIETKTVTLACDGDRVFDAHVAAPASGRGTGILICSEMFGLNDVMRKLAGSYAERGYTVLVPNVFWRSTPNTALAYEGPEREIAFQRLKAFDFDAAAADIRIAVDALRAQPTCAGKVAAIGFCMGGNLAYLAAARAGVDAAVSFYALGISRHLDEMAGIRCPVQLHYGLNDEHVPTAEIEAVGAAARANPRVEVLRYPGVGHSFFNAVRPTYDAAAAALAEQRLSRLLESL